MPAPPQTRILLATLGVALAISACGDDSRSGGEVDAGHEDAPGADTTVRDAVSDIAPDVFVPPDVPTVPTAPIPRGEWEFEPPPVDPTVEPDFEPPTEAPTDGTELPWPVSEANIGSPTGAPAYCRTGTLADADAGIWSDETGIYLLTSGYEYTYGGENNHPDETTRWLIRHRGDAWEPISSFDLGVSSLDIGNRVVAAGELFIFQFSLPTLNRYSGEVLPLGESIYDRAIADSLHQALFEDADRDWAWVDTAAYHDGTQWRRSGVPSHPLEGTQRVAWAGQDGHAVAGSYGMVSILEDGEWRLSPFPWAETISAVAQLHGEFYAVVGDSVWRTVNGEEWVEVGRLFGCPTDPHTQVISIERVGERLVVATDFGLAEVTPNGVEPMVDFRPDGACEQELILRDVAHVPGLGSAMVMQTISDHHTVTGVPCAQYVLVWDGTELWWL